MPRNSGIASGESMRRKPGGWDEVAVDAAGQEAWVEMLGAGSQIRRYAL